MPWKETTAMLEKREFINDWLSGVFTVSHLCGHYGISRSLGHRLIERFRCLGDAGLEVFSRAPHHIPNKTSPKVEVAICKERKAHPRWGSEKLLLRGSKREYQDPIYRSGGRPGSP